MTTQVRIQLSKTMAKPFWPVHQDVKHHGHTYYICGGGRGSTKSSYISQEILLLLMQHRDCNQTPCAIRCTGRWNGPWTRCISMPSGKRP